MISMLAVVITADQKLLKSQHWPGQSFGRLMVLLHDIVEVFDLQDLDPGFVVCVVAVYSRGVDTALVNGDLSGNTMSAGSLAQEAQRRLVLTLGCKKKVDCGTSFVGGPIQE